MGNQRRPPRKQRKRKLKTIDEEPFIFLFIKVGFCILCTCWVATHTAVLFFSSLPTVSHSPQKVMKSLRYYHDNPHNDIDRNGSMLPVFKLESQRMKYDVFGMHKLSGIDGFNDEVSRLTKQFTSLYGGENAARYLLHSGVTTFDANHIHTKTDPESMFDVFNMQNVPSGIKHTAYRIFKAKKEQRPFKISFGGYSVTVGRGNYFNQSYPFVLQNLLSKPMEILGIELQVRNAAIGGVPSFPYGWCLDNFLGDDADVISWDYSMNEAGGVAGGLEAYMRRGLSMDRQPMLIVKDTSIGIAKDRYDLLQSYVNVGALRDPIVMSIEDVIDTYLQTKEDLLPVGFREWRKFGAPIGSPGQTLHHPGVKEHELYGWLLTMHFLAALELVAHLVSREKSNGVLMEAELGKQLVNRAMLPAPIRGEDTILSNLQSLFHGRDTKGVSRSSSLTWKMNQVHCRTTYDPILKNDLQDIIVSGTLGENLDIMLPRGSQLYNKGWVFDLGENEKTAKKRLERYGGLGYIDSKKAYYGIKASGPLEMFLPCAGRVDTPILDEGVPARKCFQNIVVCEVNEKHDGKECNINTDLSFIVGGVKSEIVEAINSTGTSYYGRNICIRVELPPDAPLTKHENKIGVSFSVSVARAVTLRSGPCSISHVVWEQIS